jgi:hypothetical protein
MDGSGTGFHMVPGTSEINILRTSYIIMVTVLLCCAVTLSKLDSV